MKTLFKWLSRLIVGLVLLAALLALGRNFLLRQFLEWRLAAATGMEARIGYLHLGLTQPTVRIEDLKLYSPAEFGGATFVEVPEVYVEYDRDAVLARRIHLGRVRFHLAALNIVESREGKTNLELLMARQKPKSGGAPASGLERWKPTVVSFAGIDRLDLTLGRVVFSSLKKPGKAREVNLDVNGTELKNVKSAADLSGFMMGLMLKHGVDFLGLRTAAAENSTNAAGLKPGPAAEALPAPPGK